jgi:hypothetical protein
MPFWHISSKYIQQTSTLLGAGFVLPEFKQREVVNLGE